MNTMKLYYLLFLGLLIFPIISGAYCASSAANTQAEVSHDSRVYVALKGTFSDNESATAIVDGQSIGIIKPGSPQYIRVDTIGTHSVSATTINIPTTFTLSGFKVGRGEYKTINIECDFATVTIKSDGLYALDGVTLNLTVSNGVNQTGFLPGVPITISKFPPGKDLLFVFKDQNGKVRHTLKQTIQYKSTFSYTVPYQ
jgi:hypothetical protein